MKKPESSTKDAKAYEYKQPLSARMFRVLTSDFAEQNYLGKAWIPLLLRVAPKKYRRNLALKLLGMSPHYLIYQWSTRYPSTMSRMEVLEAEHQRNASSRKELCEQVLRPYLRPQMTVLDFGCGPGYAAREAAKYCHQVIAVDISCGVIACARELNDSDNVFYCVNNEKGLSMLDTSSLDLIYSFAVIQHLSEELFEGFLKEFFRVLKPKGRVVCHIALDGKFQTETEDREDSPLVLGYLKTLFPFRMVYRSTESVFKQIVGAGFGEPTITQIKKISKVKDDVAEQHLFVFEKGDSPYQR